MDKVISTTTGREVDLFVKCQSLEGQVKRLQADLDRARALLDDCHDFIVDYEDVKDGDEGDGPQPNRAMSLCQEIVRLVDGDPL